MLDHLIGGGGDGVTGSPAGRDDDSLYEGVIASGPDENGHVEVTIPAFDSSLRFGPCPYVARGASTPERGDLCLVIFAEGRHPWVIAEGDRTPAAAQAALDALEARVAALEAAAAP